MSEAAAALGRKDADRWLAKAVIDVVAAERARAGWRPGRRRRPAAPAAPRAVSRRSPRRAYQSQTPGRNPRPSRPSRSRRASRAASLRQAAAATGRPGSHGSGDANRAGAARRARTGPLRRHRRCRHVRDRPHHAGPRHRGVRQRLRPRPPPSTSSRRSAPGCTSGHAAGQLGDADTVVVSSAIRESNPELAEARRRGLRVLHRAAALASLMSGRQVIAVTGTHGKTTTTSMITTVLLETGRRARLRDRRRARRHRRRRGRRRRPGTSWRRRTRATGRSSCTRPTWRSSPTSRPTTWTTTAPRQAYRASFRAFLGRVAPAACWSPPPTTRAPSSSPPTPVTWDCVSSPTASRPTPDYRVTNVTASGMDDQRSR